MTIYNKEIMKEILIDDVHVNPEALDLVLSLNGNKEQVYKDILFAYTGISDFNYYVEEIKYEK